MPSTQNWSGEGVSYPGTGLIVISCCVGFGNGTQVFQGVPLFNS